VQLMAAGGRTSPKDQGFGWPLRRTLKNWVLQLQERRRRKEEEKRRKREEKAELGCLNLKPWICQLLVLDELFLHVIPGELKS
jgi:hypothetical protein